mmetsp:Transcript_43607/g.111017  ORF Transcript_43607/g.111017 Transcript_43607/m.111017 type:complete len:200 (+) Transcript_43607:1782-2381(+)
MATIGERIKNIGSANSSSWNSKEEEKAGRAAMHESQKRRGAWIKQQADAEHNLVQEVANADREAAKKRKMQNDMELNALMEEQKSEAGAAPKPVPGMFLARARQDEPKAKRLPGFLAVKKQKLAEEGTTDAAATAAALEAVDSESGAAKAAGADVQATGTGSGSGGGSALGLGDYGSSSEDEDDDEEEGTSKVPPPSGL